MPMNSTSEAQFQHHASVTGWLQHTYALEYLRGIFLALLAAFSLGKSLSYDLGKHQGLAKRSRLKNEKLNPLRSQRHLNFQGKYKKGLFEV